MSTATIPPPSDQQRSRSETRLPGSFRNNAPSFVLNTWISRGSVNRLQVESIASRPTYRLVQLLRAVAALMVVIFHSIVVLDIRNDLHIRDWANGASGVDIFFVVSGFVMMLSSASLTSAPRPGRTFLTRRIERVAPMYWLVTTIKLLALLAAPNIALSGQGGLWHVIASYLFLPSRNPNGVVDPLLTVGWTLNFEMAFYLLFALTLATRLPRMRVMAPILLFLSAASLFPFVKHNEFARFYASSMNLEFLLGMLIAQYRHQVREIPPAFAGIVGIAGFLPFVLHRTSFPIMWRGTFCTMIMVAAIALEPHIGHRAPRWLLEIGNSSYSLYLVHGFVLPAVAAGFILSGNRASSTLMLPVLVAIVASIFAGQVTYRFIERPLYEWFKGRRCTAIPAYTISPAGETVSRFI